MSEEQNIDPKRIPGMITDYLAGELSDEEKRQVDELVASSEEIAAEFETQKTTWEMAAAALRVDAMPKTLEPDQYKAIFDVAVASSAKEKKSVDPKENIELEKTKILLKKRTIKFSWMEIAASFVVASVVLFMYLGTWKFASLRMGMRPNLAFQKRNEVFDMECVVTPKAEEVAEHAVFEEEEMKAHGSDVDQNKSLKELADGIRDEKKLARIARRRKSVLASSDDSSVIAAAAPAPAPATVGGASSVTEGYYSRKSGMKSKRAQKKDNLLFLDGQVASKPVPAKKSKSFFAYGDPQSIPAAPEPPKQSVEKIELQMPEVQLKTPSETSVNNMAVEHVQVNISMPDLTVKPSNSALKITRPLIIEETKKDNVSAPVDNFNDYDIESNLDISRAKESKDERTRSDSLERMAECEWKFVSPVSKPQSSTRLIKEEKVGVEAPVVLDELANLKKSVGEKRKPSFTEKAKKLADKAKQFLSLAALNSAREKARRISCASNLKQIGLSLKQYSMDFNDFFPDRNGAEGLEQLRAGDYLSDRRIYICPTTAVKPGNGPLAEDSVGYLYIGGLTETAPADLPIVFDKSGNHEKHGNILFLDGHVKGFNWNEFIKQVEKAEKYIEEKKKKEEEKPQSEMFKLNLKLWDLTKPEYVRNFLKKKGVDASQGKLKIFVNKDANTITFVGQREELTAIGSVMESLIETEYELEKNRRGIPFLDTKMKPVSTFSIDVDTASYTATRKMLKEGKKPSPNSIRPEEFINYFDYHYRSPVDATFAVYLEAAPAIFRPNDVELRVGVQGKRLGPDNERPSSFTVLIDTSGSMATKDRLALVKKSMEYLLDQMRPNDRISIMTCEENPKVLVNNHPAASKDGLTRVINGITTGSFANIERGIVSAYDLASRNYWAGGNNRVIVFTDGIVEIDSKSAEEIVRRVESERKKGIGNTIIGLGGDGDDHLLETIANKGDGMYVFLDDEEEARELFINQFAATFREIARDVKIQVEFNPEFVEKYRQIGYQNRQLSKADFRDDKVDAGEVGSGQSVTALYEMKMNTLKKIREPLQAEKEGTNTVAVVRLRYRRVDTLEIEEREYPLTIGEIRNSAEAVSASFKLAEIVAEFAEYLRYPGAPGVASPENMLGRLRPLANGFYKNDAKVQELYELINRCR